MFRKSLLLLLLFASVQVFSQDPLSQHHPAYAWDRIPGQGKEWLSRSREFRRGYAYGYLTAYRLAFSEGCRQYSLVVPPEKMPEGTERSSMNRCVDSEPLYDQVTGYYEEAITAYYKKYPGDVDLPTAWLFLGFSKSEHKSPEEMHKAWINHSPP